MKRESAELAALSKLLDDGLDLAPEARPTWIENLPATADGLKPALRKLLLVKASSETADVIGIGRHVQAAISGAASLTEAMDLAPGSNVGPYELIRELGRGGMGTVWQARRTEGLTHRMVALKLPHAGLFHAELAERMARERDILENLAHPNIARIYDAGITPAGQPYLALEYIEGTPITEYCDELRLGLRARTLLFVQVLQAIQYAHGNLVIHRDLKPANILVTKDGVAVVLDFGIAKLLTADVAADSALTQLGGRALTPDYASPEQICNRPVSIASDVYSLGVLLSELLCGSRPYYLKRDSRGALEDAIVEAEPRAPSRNAQPEAALLRGVSINALSRALRGDLDNIVLKALRKNPQERYASVDLFAQDILRYLHGEAVLANPGSARYRAGKFLRRHKLAVASAATIVAVLVAGAAAALWQAHQARLEAERAEQVKSFALSMIDSADTDAGADKQTTAVDLLRAAAKRVESELAGRPAIAAELMTAIGYGLIGQDHSEEAAELLKKAIALSTQAAGADNQRTVAAQVVYGEALYDLGKNAEAMAVLKPAVERAHRIHAVHEEIDALRWLSSVQIDAGDKDAGVASARLAVTALPSLPTADRRTLHDAFQAHQTLANALASAEMTGVVAEARIALDLETRLDGAANSAQGLDVRLLLGRGLVREGHVVDGLRELRSAFADCRKLLGDNHRKTSIFANLLGYADLDAGQVQDAVLAYQFSFDAVMQRPAEQDPFGKAMSHYGLAVALSAARQREQALPHFDAAARLFATAGGPNAQLALRSRSAQALTLAQLGRLDDAEHAFASLATAPFAGIEISTHKGRLATLRSLQGRNDEAIALARSSAEELQAAPSTTVRAQSLARLGAVLLAANRTSEAVPPLERSIALFHEVQPQESPDLADAMAALRRADGAR